MITTILLAALASSPVVVDQANLLNDEQTQVVQKQFSEIQKDDHVVMGLFTVSSVGDIKNEALQDIAKFNLGPSSVAMVISMQPRKIYIQPGTQLASKFTADTTTRLIRKHMVPSMGKGEYGVGIVSGVDAVRSEIEDSSHFGWWLFGLLVLGGVTYLFWRRRDEFESVVVPSGHYHVHGGSSTAVPGQPVTVAAPGIRPVGNYTTRRASTTVINNNNGGSGGFVEGMIIGDLLNNRGGGYGAPAVQPSAPTPSYQDDGLGGGGVSFGNDTTASDADTSDTGVSFGDTSGGGSDFGDTSGGDSGFSSSDGGGSGFGGSDSSDSGSSFDSGSSDSGSDFGGGDSGGGDSF